MMKLITNYVSLVYTAPRNKDICDCNVFSKCKADYLPGIIFIKLQLSVLYNSIIPSYNYDFNFDFRQLSRI